MGKLPVSKEEAVVDCSNPLLRSAMRNKLKNILKMNDSASDTLWSLEPRLSLISASLCLTHV